MKEISTKKSSISFMTKKEFVDRKGSECFSVTPSADEKLSKFKDDDILAIDVSISSPAIVTDLNKVEGIVDFLNKRFEEEGVNKEKINESFKSFE